MRKKYLLDKPVYVCYAEFRYSSEPKTGIAYAYLIGIVSGIKLRLGNAILIQKMYVFSKKKVIEILKSGENIYNLNYDRKSSLELISCPSWHGLVKDNSYLYVVRDTSFNCRKADFIKFLISTFKDNKLKQKLYLALGWGYLYPKKPVKTYSLAEVVMLASASKSKGSECSGQSILISDKTGNNHILVVPDNVQILTKVFQGTILHGRIKVIGGGPNLVSVNSLFMG